MRSYMRNTDSAGTIVPTILDKGNACQHGNCTVSGSGTTLSSFALSSPELTKLDLKLCLVKVPFSSPPLDMSC